MSSKIFQFWRTAVTIVTPLLLCPLIFYVKTSEAKCAFLIMTMAVFWVRYEQDVNSRRIKIGGKDS